MSPAVTLAWYVVAASVVSIALTETVPIVASLVRSVGALPPVVGRLVAAVGVGVILLAVVRPQFVTAATPPPSDRVVLMAPEAGQEVAAFLPRPGARVITEADGRDAYRVVKGDSLWAIARSRLARHGSVPSGSSVSELWRVIFDANRSVIGDDPNLIIPGQILMIPESVDG